MSFVRKDGTLRERQHIARAAPITVLHNCQSIKLALYPTTAQSFTLAARNFSETVLFSGSTPTQKSNLGKRDRFSTKSIRLITEKFFEGAKLFSVIPP
jgi:hypothetical protein